MKVERITWLQQLFIWFCISVPLAMLNTLLFKIPVLHNIILASLGMMYIAFPKYPKVMEQRMSPSTCRIIVCVVGIAQVILSFGIKYNF